MVHVAFNAGMRDRTDWIVGYRHAQLDDALWIGENITDQTGTQTIVINALDRFETENQFNGLQLGVVRRTLLGRGWLESSLRVAVGNNKQTVRISGASTRELGAVTQNSVGGLLAQSSNIGSWDRDQFVLLPELGVRLGIRITSCLQATIGYSLMYFPNVVRSGDQIDLDVNANLIPPSGSPLSGALRPRVLWRESDYLAHGLHLGGELHY